MKSEKQSHEFYINFVFVCDFGIKCCEKHISEISAGYLFFRFDIKHFVVAPMSNIHHADVYGMKYPRIIGAKHLVKAKYDHMRKFLNTFQPPPEEEKLLEPDPNAEQ